MLKILIVDDEPLARERLAGLLSELGICHQAYEAGNGLQALEHVSQLQPDIVLLDIRMPVMDGLEAAQHLSASDNPPAIIFTTAYQDHALEAFDIHAVDYLLKPVRLQRLGEALERARLLNRAAIGEVRMNDRESGIRTHLSASYKGELTLIPVNEIRYLRAEQKYVIAGWPGGELLLDESLVSLEQELSGGFVRIHRSALVAQAFIDSLKKGPDGNFCLSMRGVDTRLPVSRRNLSHLRKLLREISH